MHVSPRRAGYVIGYIQPSKFIEQERCMSKLRRFLHVCLFGTVVLSMVFPGRLAAAEEKNKENEQEEPAIINYTEEVEVVGNVPKINTIQSVTVFKIDDMAAFNFEGLKSVLNLTPGVLSLSTGKFGQSSSTYIRGSKSSQVLYIVDGIKLRDGANLNGVDLSVLSPTIIDKVEVVRGPLSSIYGSEAMGGVISMNTFSREGAEFIASYGSHDSYMGGFSGSTSLKDWVLGFSINTQRYSDNVVNDVFKNTGLTAKLNYKKNALDGGLRFFGSFTDSGIPFDDFGGFTPSRKYTQKYMIAALPLNYTINNQSKINLNLSYTDSKYEFEDIEDIWSPYFMSRFKNIEAELIYSTLVMKNINLDAGLDYSDQTIISKNDLGSVLDDEKANYFSSFVNAGWNKGPVQISASVRYDKYKNIDGNLSPQVGMSYLIANSLKLRAAYARSFVAPFISQLVNPWGLPNFDLKPEKAESFEFGAEYYSERLTLSATYFNTRYKDMIDWVTVDWVTYQGQYQNIDNVDTYGVELAATTKPFRPLTVSAAYTWLHSEDKATGNPLVRKPKHTFSGYLSYVHKRFSLTVDMVYVGKRPDLDFTAWPVDVENPAFNTYNVSLVVPVIKGLSVFGKITNAFDKEYQEFFNYPAPGRRFELGLKFRVR